MYDKKDIIERAKKVLLSSDPKDYIEFVGELAKENETIPEDVKEATNQYIGYPPEVDEGVSTSQRRKAFADGMLAERWRVNRKAEVLEGYDPEYDKEALEAADEYVKGTLSYGAFCLMRPAFADGWMSHKEWLIKRAVEIDMDITINRRTKQHILHINSTDEHIQHLPQGEYRAIIIKKEK